MEIVLCVLVVLLIVLRAPRPNQSQLSTFELQRRVDANDDDARETWRKNDLYPYVRALQFVIDVVLLVYIAGLAIYMWGWGVGAIAAIFIGILYRRVATISAVRAPMQRIYNTHEERILRVTEALRGVLANIVESRESESLQVASREELKHVVDENARLLSATEKSLLHGALTYENELVRDVMTPRGVIHSVPNDELLGPLVLDDLHQSGHSHFPVRSGDVDHIVGVLHVQDLLTLQEKKSAKAEDVMDKRVYYIRDDQTLAHALQAFITTKRHLFIVINTYRETVGIITLEDVMEVLLGQKIVDQFDQHDDMRVVAERNLNRHNVPPRHVDV